LLDVTSLLGCNLVSTLIGTVFGLRIELFEDIAQYIRLSGKLIYLTVIRPYTTSPKRFTGRRYWEF